MSAGRQPGRLRRFLRLPPGERALLLKAVAVVGGVRLGLSLLPASRVLRRAEKLGRVRESGRRAGGDGLTPDRIAWGVRTASRLVPGASCLTRALAARVLLGRYGHASRVVIGVAREGGEFGAHAWTEVEGRAVIGEREKERYRPLPDLERALR